MWIKKINEYFENMSEYDNNSLVLHVAVDFIDMLKERVTFVLDDECNMTITVLKHDSKEDTEVDEEGFMYWLQMKFHRELIENIMTLKNSHDTLENTIKQLNNDAKQTEDNTEINETIESRAKELEAIEMVMNKVNTYRTNTFTFLRDKEDIDKMISYIRIYKEQSD
jgi:hypothetical protein